MRYLSVCSGIEAASVAWHPLGWEAFAYSEIDKFPCAVLKHHYPDTPNFGDMNKFKDWPDANVDVLVGGTPCQSFSIAGLRKGLDDPRGNLMLTYLAIADKYRPKWLLWENVPGVLSSNGGRDFGALLGGLAKLGYGFAYRVLDAQYVRTDGHPYAVPQRRRRVFVVGHIGSWQRATAVLFDRESLSGNPPPSRRAGQKATGFTASSFGQYSETIGALCARDFKGVGNQYVSENKLQVGVWPAEIAPTLNAHFGRKQGGGYSCQAAKTLTTKTRIDAETETLIPMHGGYFDKETITFGIPGNWIGRNPKNGGNAVEPMIDIAPCQTKTDVHAVAFKMRGGCEGGGKGYLGSEDTAFTLSTTQDQQVAFYENHPADSRVTEMGEVCTTVTSRWGTGGGNVPYAQMQMQVRRLTPTECARLQGFPDSYLSQVPGASDSAMYKALGNSFAVNVMQLLGQRIAMVDAIADIKAVA